MKAPGRVIRLVDVERRLTALTDLVGAIAAAVGEDAVEAQFRRRRFDDLRIKWIRWEKSGAAKSAETADVRGFVFMVDKDGDGDCGPVAMLPPEVLGKKVGEQFKAKDGRDLTITAIYEEIQR